MKYIVLSLTLVSFFCYASETEKKKEKLEPKVTVEAEQPIERVKLEKIEVNMTGRYPASGRGGRNLR